MTAHFTDVRDALAYFESRGCVFGCCGHFWWFLPYERASTAPTTDWNEIDESLWLDWRDRIRQHVVSQWDRRGVYFDPANVKPGDTCQLERPLRPRS